MKSSSTELMSSTSAFSMPCMPWCWALSERRPAATARSRRARCRCRSRGRVRVAWGVVERGGGCGERPGGPDKLSHRGALVLDRARRREVARDGARRLDVTEHERDVRLEPERMREPVLLEPLVRRHLVGTDDG